LIGGFLVEIVGFVGFVMFWETGRLKSLGMSLYVKFIS